MVASLALVALGIMIHRGNYKIGQISFDYPLPLVLTFVLCTLPFKETK